MNIICSLIFKMINRFRADLYNVLSIACNCVLKVVRCWSGCVAHYFDCGFQLKKRISILIEAQVMCNIMLVSDV